jgi:hypothetical protein
MPFDPDTSIEMANESSGVITRPFTCQTLQVDPPPCPILLAPLIACARLSAATACFRDRASVTRLSLAPPRSGMTLRLLVDPRRPSAAAAEPAVAPRDRDSGRGFCLGAPPRAGAAGAGIAL